VCVCVYLFVCLVGNGMVHVHVGCLSSVPFGPYCFKLFMLLFY